MQGKSKLCVIFLALGSQLMLTRAQVLQNSPKEDGKTGHGEPNKALTCRPTFDLADYLNGSWRGTREMSSPNELKLDVADIDLPLDWSSSSSGLAGSAPSASSHSTTGASALGSALRFLSRIGHTLETGASPCIEGSELCQEADERLSSDEQTDQLQGAKDEEEDERNVIKFRENKLFVRGLNLTMLNVHLFAPDQAGHEPRIGVGVQLANTTLVGRFAYRGPELPLSDSRLTGFYRMSISNVYLVVGSSLKRHVSLSDGSQPSMNSSIESTRVQLKTSNFRLNITNLGYISIDIFDSRDLKTPTSSYLLRLLQRLLQRTVKKTYYQFEQLIRESLEHEAQKSVDCELSQFEKLLLPRNATTASGQVEIPSQPAEQQIQSDLARILSNELGRSQFGSISLPDYEHKQALLATSATVHFRNGSLAGLHQIRFSGETRLKLQEEHLFLNTSIGWYDLRTNHDWSIFLGDQHSLGQVLEGTNSTNQSKQAQNKTSQLKQPSAQGHVSFHIKQVDFDAVVTKGIKPFTRITVDQLIIKRLDGPKMDISGLPGVNRLTRRLVNFFMARLKQRLTASLQPVLKTQLEKSLNKLVDGRATTTLGEPLAAAATTTVNTTSATR